MVHWLLEPLLSHTMSSSTQVRQTCGLLTRNAPNPREPAMVFNPTTRRLRLPLPTLASRLQSRMAVDRPVGTLYGMPSKWPVSRSRISPLVCSLHRPTDCPMTISPGLCDKISDGLLDQPVSGLMGLGWQALSSSGVTPFWQALYQNNVLDEPLMGFYLTRFQNDSGAKQQEPGGVFTLGL